MAKVLSVDSHPHAKDIGRYGLVSYVIQHESRDSILQKLYILGPTIRIEVVKWWFNR